jgi:hypothetical protein
MPSPRCFAAYPGNGSEDSKAAHFKQIWEALGGLVEYSDFIFFDDLFSNIKCARKVGLGAYVLVGRQGMTMELLQKGLAEWRSSRSSAGSMRSFLTGGGGGGGRKK